MFSSHMSVRAALVSHCHSDLDTSFGECVSRTVSVLESVLCVGIH